MLLSILFLFLNSTDIPTKQVPETKYANFVIYFKTSTLKEPVEQSRFTPFFTCFREKNKAAGKKVYFYLVKTGLSTYRISEI